MLAPLHFVFVRIFHEGSQVDANVTVSLEVLPLAEHLSQAHVASS